MVIHTIMGIVMVPRCENKYGYPASPGIVAYFLCRYDISHNVGPTQKVYKPSHHWDSDPVI